MGSCSHDAGMQVLTYRRHCSRLTLSLLTIWTLYEVAAAVHEGYYHDEPRPRVIPPVLALSIQLDGRMQRLFCAALAGLSETLAQCCAEHGFADDTHCTSILQQAAREQNQTALWDEPAHLAAVAPTTDELVQPEIRDDPTEPHIVAPTIDELARPKVLVITDAEAVGLGPTCSLWAALASHAQGWLDLAFAHVVINGDIRAAVARLMHTQGQVPNLSLDSAAHVASMFAWDFIVEIPLSYATLRYPHCDSQ